MKEINVTGQFYRILVDKTNKIWHRLSFWTKASDVQFDDGSFLQNKTFGHAILKRSSDYKEGDIAYCTNTPSWVMLKCVVAGKTASLEPADYKAIQLSGVQIVDGTATFVIQDKRTSKALSDSNNDTPTTALAKETMENAVTNAFQADATDVYVGVEGKLHFVDNKGTDTALDFDPHDGTYTFASGDTGATKDLGEVHNIKYVNASEVYSKGYNDGIKKNLPSNIKIVYHHHVHSQTSATATDGGVADEVNATGPADNDHIYGSEPKGCYTKPYYELRTERCPANAGYSRSSWTEQRPWTAEGYAGFYDNIDHVTKTCNVCGKSWEAENHDPDTPAHDRTVNKMVGYSIGCGLARGKLVKEDIIYS